MENTKKKTRKNCPPQLLWHKHSRTSEVQYNWPHPSPALSLPHVRNYQSGCSQADELKYCRQFFLLSWKQLLSGLFLLNSVTKGMVPFRSHGRLPGSSSSTQVSVEGAELTPQHSLCLQGWPSEMDPSAPPAHFQPHPHTPWENLRQDTEPQRGNSSPEDLGQEEGKRIFSFPSSPRSHH